MDEFKGRTGRSSVKKDPRKEKMSGDDVVVDHGSYNCMHQADEDDIAGHRAVYVGIHMPLKNKSHRHRHHKHRHHRSKENNTDHDASQGDSQTPLLSAQPPAKERRPSEEQRQQEQPSQRVKFILGDESTADEEHQSHEVFTELEELSTAQDGDEMEWKETARWIKYEEAVDEGAGRWSKPHIATLSLHSLFELRNCLMNGAVCLDMDAGNLDLIADLVMEKLSNLGQLDDDKKEQVKAALLKKHHHHGQKKQKKSNTALMPMIRTLTDIGRSLSNSGNQHVSMEEAAAHIDSHASTPNFHKTNSLTVESEMSDTASEGMVKVASGPSMKARTSFMRKIPQNAEASNVLVGEVDFLPRPIIAFVRLLHSVLLGDLTEVPIPTRFLFIMLGPPTEQSARYHEIGRCIATLMSDKVFHDVAYKAKSVEDLLAGIDEFMDQVTVLPPGVWDPNIRIEPPKTSPPPQTKRLEGLADHMGNGDIPVNGTDEPDHQGLERTGRLFGGLIKDIKRRAPHYLSDYKDALHIQCVASFIFMYFACITPVVTFGGLLGEATDQQVSTMESLLGASACGVAFHLLSGQPLTILGSTGPILVYEKIMASVCGSLGWDYLPFRAWVGLWTMLLCLVLVATDASSMVKYFTRFVEESFSTLISFIFIYEAIHKLINIYHEYPIHRFPLLNQTEYDCECHPNTTSDYYTDRIENMWHTSLKECKANKGHLLTVTGEACHESEPVSDVFLMSAILMFGTFTIAYSLKMFKNTRYFPTVVRRTVSDFSVFLAVVIMVTVDLVMGIPTPKLPVPTEFKPTSNERDYWVVPLFAPKNPWWSIILAILPALLATILIFMDQQITAVIVNRKENKLKKGVGYHLDLLIVCVMLGMCSVFGLPWFVAATVLSINHVNSLRVESECKAPGETPKVIGCREQRVTGVLVFVFIGLAVLMTSILNKIAMPVLYGVFLFMGISSLKGVQFVNRIKLFFMPPKHQPDYTYLRNVGIQRVHLFTFIQLMCLVILWIIKTTIAALIFPIMVVGMVFVRKLMDFIFTQEELSNLDDIMPEVIKRDRHEREKKKEEEAAAEKERMNQCTVPGRVQVPLSGGNVLSIPVEKVKFEPDSRTINISDEMSKCGVWKFIAENSETHTMPKHHHKDSQAVPTLETIPSSPRESTIFEVGEQSSQEDVSDFRIEVPTISVQEDQGETPV
ncbi:electroneutral sodium bicarbonate exchanger 1-like isoform X2 [Apostichopus japonicus]|uniref:electroneutral sodium bicarbonate exchanger 1-like isoform X2 n=1 Tax=Stichopus japonicus TaxID=307972 RepID=UPI003AB5E4DD